MTSYVVSLKQYNTQSRIHLEILKRYSSKLASGLYIMSKEAKLHLSCCYHDNSYAAALVLIETKILRFYLKQGSSIRNILVGILKSIWEPFVCQARPSVQLKKDCKWGYLVFHRKRLELRVLPWQQHSRCHSVSFVMYVTLLCQVWRTLLQYFWRYSWLSVVLFNETTYDVITFLICIIQKC